MGNEHDDIAPSYTQSRQALQEFHSPAYVAFGGEPKDGGTTEDNPGPPKKEDPSSQ